jgi:hypothetical protein
MVQSQPRRELLRPISETTLAWWFKPAIPATQEAEVGELQLGENCSLKPAQQKHETLSEK